MNADPDSSAAGPAAGHRAYRPDIDGLRAVAVLLVVFFHYHVSAFRGGFVGVDVFFVISGYLISSIILGELDGGNFSLLAFYVRRARRILPALCAVSLTAAGAAACFFFPGDLVEAGQSLAATALFVSNIFFWSVTGYFSTSIWEKPLLHTWSLGVEEQFYLFFPLLLMAVHRYGRGRGKTAAIAVCALASFIAAVYTVHHWPEAAFYLLPFRFWELATGGLLAAAPQLKFRRAWIYDVLTLAGLAMIVAAAMVYSKHTLFPGLSALLPCAGAALVVFAGARARRGGWILRAKPVNFIGRLSYSLYLWHWPLQSFIQYRFGDAMTSGGWREWLWRGGALAASFALAWLSWRFIERPFRQPGLISRRAVLTAAAASIAVMAGAGGVLTAADGFPARLPAAAVALAAGAQDRAHPPFNVCIDAADPQAADPHCLIGDAAAPAAQAVIWGNSHAGAMQPALDAFLRAHGVKAIQFIRSSCVPFGGAVRETDAEYQVCPAFNAKVAAYIRAHGEVRYVFLDGRWASHTQGTRFAGDKQDAFYRALAATVKDLEAQGKKVFIIGPVPEVAFDVPRCLSRQAAYGPRFFACAPPAAAVFAARQKEVEAAFARLAGNAVVYRPGQVLCGGGTCDIMHDGQPLYFDDNHLSVQGALYLEDSLSGAFAPALAAGKSP